METRLKCREKHPRNGSITEHHGAFHDCLGEGGIAEKGEIGES